MFWGFFRTCLLLFQWLKQVWIDLEEEKKEAFHQEGSVIVYNRVDWMRMIRDE